MIWLQLQNYGFAVWTTLKNYILEIFALNSEWAFENKESMEAGFKAKQYMLHMIFATVRLGFGVQWTRVSSGDHVPA